MRFAAILMAAAQASGGAAGGGGGAVIGDELIAGGAFASSTGWFLSDASIAGGVCTFDGTIGAHAYCFATETLVPGEYHFTADDVNGSGGNLSISVGGGTPITAFSDGVTYDGTGTVSGTLDQSILITDDFGTGMTIDNASLKRTA